MPLRFSSELDISKFEKALHDMERKSKSTADTIVGDFSAMADRLPAGGLLKSFGLGGVAVAGVAAGLVAVTKAGDSATLSIARINSVLGDMDSAKDVYKDLAELAGETGVAVSTSAAQFARFSLAGKQIGATNEQVVTLIGAIQKAGAISGSSTNELAAGATQLGQALASGRLQGDELRSILENMPMFGEALARNLGVSVGRLREMGAEGTLTTEKVFPALLKAAGEIQAKFEQMPPTIGRGWDMLKAKVTQTLVDIDRIGNSSGITASILMGLAGGNKSSSERTWQTYLASIESRNSRKTASSSSPAMSMAHAEMWQERELKRVSEFQKTEEANRKEQEKSLEYNERINAQWAREAQQTADARRKIEEKLQGDLTRMYADEAENQRKIGMRGMQDQLNSKEQALRGARGAQNDAIEAQEEWGLMTPDERRAAKRAQNDKDRETNRAWRLRHGNARDARPGGEALNQAARDAAKNVVLAEGELAKFAKLIALENAKLITAP